MVESRLLLAASAALLILALGMHWPALSQRIPRAAWWLGGAGALLPLLDLVIAHAPGSDQISALSGMPVFSGPLPGMGVIACGALAAATWFGPKAAILALASMTGFALNLALGALTAWGVPWLAPFSAQRWGWALFPPGHAVTLVLLAAALAALELRPGWSRAVRSGSAGLIAGYWGLAVAGHLWVAAQAAAPGAAVGIRLIEPDGPLALCWLVVDHTPSEYQVQVWRIGAQEPEAKERVPRWNDEPGFLEELADPVVFRLYSRTFLHPVAEVARSGSQTTLTMQELSSGLLGKPGPTFLLKSDQDGRNRLYRMERFD